MNCPRCNSTLAEIPKSGVMVDLCPQCKGVWLDRGELEKLAASTKEFHHEFQQYFHKSHHHKKQKPLWLQILDILD